MATRSATVEIEDLVVLADGADPSVRVGLRLDYKV